MGRVTMGAALRFVASPQLGGNPSWGQPWRSNVTIGRMNIRDLAKSSAMSNIVGFIQAGHPHYALCIVVKLPFFTGTSIIFKGYDSYFFKILDLLPQRHCTPLPAAHTHPRMHFL